MTEKKLKIARFEDLRPWIESRRLVKEVYQVCNLPAFARDHDLVSQIRRAAVSVMANIAEGFGSGSEAEFRRFLGYSARSLLEVESHLYVALDQKYVERAQLSQIYRRAEEIRKLLGEVESEWADDWG